MTRRALFLALGLTACGGPSAEPTTPPTAETPRYDRVERLRFNQLAVRLNLPLFWAADADDDGAVDPAEVRALRFYPTEGRWVRGGVFTPEFERAYASVVAAAAATAPEDTRLRLVVEELDGIAPTVIENDLSSLPEAHRTFARHMLRVAELIDALYARQVGAEALTDRVARDEPASRSLFRRNWGARCRGATTESDPDCSAIAGAPAQPVDVYPAAMQAEEGFCQALEAREDSDSLLTPFSVVREREGELTAVPYPEAYGELMEPIAEELRAAAEALTDPDEEPLRAYLRAAAQAFEDNDWEPADEAWAAMNVRNSRWYVRVGPDEVYWDPCSQKAGFHLTLALIDQGSLEWQDRLSPIQQDMEQALATLVEPYEAREVSFHLPDFIEIVVNAGDDRDPFGATIGQSLPNWGPVSDEGRGRTVAMTNLYQDPDSLARRRAVAASLLTHGAMETYTDDTTPALINTILHEATHNLGPASGHRVSGQDDAALFGGGLASMLEELKAQTGALYYTNLLVERGIIDEARAREIYVDGMTWAFGHISRGMYTPSGQRKAYSQLAAVQVGWMLEHDAMTWDPDVEAANGTDAGAFALDLERFPEAVTALMREVVRIKTEGDREAAEALAERYVDGDVVPQDVIVERYNRFPRASFVYALEI
ncbi:MAG TPA: hypothetical protein RMH99_33205 [Sandaracinaceae bacterium LLY-WYZ-13_1]|nr:hypothetical protein [Sandaracinaceae bacterium LLY-WYZ-13_1]